VSTRAVLGVLLACNLLKYIDRQVLFPLLPLIKEDLALTDLRLGLLATAFMAVYMVSAPIAGWLAQRGPRPLWMGASVALWSLAGALGAAVRSFTPLLMMRALVGVGQSAFTPLSTAEVSDRVEGGRRGRAMSYFLAAVPAGSALGFLLGGWLGGSFGWRMALVAAAAPGFLAAWAVMRIGTVREHKNEGPRPPISAYIPVLKIKTYLTITLAMAAMSFALGGFAVWLPTFYTRFFELSVGKAGLVVGGVTVTAGLVGTLLGGWLSDRLRARRSGAELLVSGGSLLVAAPLGAMAILAPSLITSMAALWVAQVFAFMQNAPLNAAIASVVAAPSRTLAYGANVFLIHALGDVWSPALIGAFSDRFGLRGGMLGASVALAVGGLLSLWAMRYHDADEAAAESAA